NTTLTISLDGGSAQTGYVLPSVGQVVQLAGQDTTGWKSAKYVISDFPESWPLPSGWTHDTTEDVYYYDTSNGGGTSPPSFTLPALNGLWGLWMFQLIVTPQAPNDQQPLPPYADTILELFPPNHTEDFAFGLLFQASRTRGWVVKLRRNMRLLETYIASSAISASVPAVLSTLLQRGTSAEGYLAWIAKTASQIAQRGFVRLTNTSQSVISAQSSANTANDVDLLAADGADGTVVGDGTNGQWVTVQSAATGFRVGSGATYYFTVDIANTQYLFNTFDVYVGDGSLHVPNGDISAAGN